MQATQEQLLEQASGFSLKHFPNLDWKFEEMRGWLGWFARGGRLGMIFDNGDLKALGAVRCVNDLSEIDNDYFHDEKGQIVWIDLFIDPLGKYVNELIDLLINRVGVRGKIGFSRAYKMDEDLRLMDFSVLEKFKQLQGV